MSDEYYLQDSRSYVGNDVLFWAKDGKGYTSDVSKAHIYTKAEAVARHQMRETDIPWPKSYIDAKTRPAVDMQYIRRAEALVGTGITLIKPKKPKVDVIKCEGCGRIMRDGAQYLGNCTHCGQDNRP
ncbi:hypothetical protein [Herminiimonas contaminans]|uniref:Zinc ribbon protein n=1 Tax=Herminiimonas contaminans TaxID=1111140 RepID=A0ABS0ESX0_9BURK|nr:hypothetical protein [Herminiimonas contaminans]MBF8177844.1 hypothetical protein [Herminiimonas contaminans]